ncbi:putative membrane protein [Escovopsis weberi]|uniref:Putative membrane protein n=1 Tax=Escovopsis weberi TaxID=150374 RepID=A0A0M9VUJ7_ESCWE|nr:putative membrane protein [Escovopsis weberi]
MAREPAAKLPMQQLAILAIARLAEPIAATSIFPYLPNMIRDLGVSQDHVAKWAGITTATFSVSQSLFAVPWGRASDRFGRKPVLVLGLLSTMLCFIVWGMSTSLPMAITVRAILGAGNGNVGIIRTMVAEMVPQKELQPFAFSLMPLVWSIGSVAGPAFGGFFAQPAKQFPGFFGDSPFFNKFPYALPNFIATVFFLISATSATFFLEETHRDLRRRKDWGLTVGRRFTRALWRNPSAKQQAHHNDEARDPLIPADTAHEPGKQPAASVSKSASTREVFTYQTVVALVAYTFLAFHSVAFDQTITVFLDYPVIPRTPENTSFPFKFTGGFGLDSGTIGSIFAFYGIMCGLVQFLLYPTLVRRYGVLNCFKFCSVLTPFVYLVTPYTSLFPTPKSRLLAVLAVLTIKAFAIIIAFPSTTILLTNSASSLRILGTLNGFATMFSGLGRAFGPATTGLAFSWGAQRGYIVTAYFFIALVAAVGAVPAFYIVEGDGPSAGADGDGRGGGEESAAEGDEGESAPLLGGPAKDRGFDYEATRGSRSN